MVYAPDTVGVGPGADDLRLGRVESVRPFRHLLVQRVPGATGVRLEGSCRGEPSTPFPSLGTHTSEREWGPWDPQPPLPRKTGPCIPRVLRRGPVLVSVPLLRPDPPEHPDPPPLDRPPGVRVQIDSGRSGRGTRRIRPLSTGPGEPKGKGRGRRRPPHPLPPEGRRRRLPLPRHHWTGICSHRGGTPPSTAPSYELHPSHHLPDRYPSPPRTSTRWRRDGVLVRGR